MAERRSEAAVLGGLSLPDLAGAELEIRLLHLPLVETLAAAHDESPDPTRHLTVVQLTTGEGTGWGECSALNEPTYTSEWAEGAFELLSQAVLPLPTEVEALHPMAASGLEMARIDVALTGRAHSLSAHLARAAGLPAPPGVVPAGVAVGILPAAELADRVVVLAEAGFGRIKVKIQPGHSVDPIAAAIARLRHTDSAVELMVDGNGAFGPDDQPEVLALIDLGVEVFEQPFAVDDLASPAALINHGARVVADEGVSSMADARRLHRHGALTGVVAKPARVGGLTAAWELLDWCQQAGVDATAGGMLECGLGRHALAALAIHPACTLPGDLSPARRWLADDPWPDLAMIGGAVMVPVGTGLAPPPDIEKLERYTVRRAVRTL